MAEWSKALVSGSNQLGGVGSNPSAVLFFSGHRRPILFNIYKMYGHDGAGYSTS